MRLGDAEVGEQSRAGVTAIRTKSVDAMLVVYAKKKSEAPYFILLERRSPADKERTETGRFAAANLLEEGRPKWQLLTQKARGGDKICPHDQGQS